MNAGTATAGFEYETGISKGIDSAINIVEDRIRQE